MPRETPTKSAESQQADNPWYMKHRVELTILVTFLAALLCMWSPLPLLSHLLSRPRAQMDSSKPKPFELPRRSVPTGHAQFSTTLRIDPERTPITVRGFPSTGGILMLPLDVAVAKHLDLPRLTTVNRAPEQADEDTFCKRLSLLGAKWWESEYMFWLKKAGMKQMTAEEKAEMAVGWPSATSKGEDKGGVWVLRAEEHRQFPLDFALLGLCVDMDERCELLERWGATYHENPATVPEFEGLIG